MRIGKIFARWHLAIAIASYIYNKTSKFYAVIYSRFFAGVRRHVTSPSPSLPAQNKRQECYALQPSSARFLRVVQEAV